VSVGLSHWSARDARSNLAVVFAPWTDTGSAVVRVAAANARLVRVGALPFVLIVQSDAPGVFARLRATGALLILDARDAVGCSGRRRRT
jgi:hypothetical protein